MPLRRLAPLALLTACALSCADEPGPLIGGGDTREWPGIVVCQEPRHQLCTRDYRPVCGRRPDGTRRTYANACTACSDTNVIDHRPGKCPAPGERPAPIRP